MHTCAHAQRREEIDEHEDSIKSKSQEKEDLEDRRQGGGDRDGGGRTAASRSNKGKTGVSDWVPFGGNSTLG